MPMRPGQAKGPSLNPPAISGGTIVTPTVVPTWLLFTVTHTQLQAAALANDIELWSVPARVIIHGVVFEPTVQFAGVGITDYKMSLGIAANLPKYMAFVDVDNAVSASNFFTSDILGAESTSAVYSLRVAARSIGANLSASTAGTLNVAILAAIWR